jgi:hypothetical protein
VTTVKFSDTAAGGQAPSTGAAAYACSRLGLRVFPLVPGTGLPALKGWPDHASTNLDVIRDWWTGEYTGYGVGIATGPESGVWVLDVDVKKGVNGFTTLVDLQGQHRDYGLTNHLTSTMVVSTPSGGCHVYFRWAEGVGNSTGTRNRLGPGLDVRADHGYVRAPGWGGYAVVPRGPEGVRVIRVQSAPEWLVKLAQKRTRNYAEDPVVPGTSWARFNASRALESFGETPEGGRNDALNRTAYKLGRSGAMAGSDAWDACVGVIVGMNAGDDMPAWRRTFESGWNAGVAARGSA